MNQVLRIAISLCVAMLLVGSLAVIGINAYFEPPPVNQVVAFRVEAATAAELEAVRLMEQPQPAPQVRPRAAPAPLDRERTRNGFVQIEFEVGADGRAVNARVIGAAPAGYYETEALSRVQRQRYVPARVDGAAATSVRTQIVEFKYTPATTR